MKVKFGDDIGLGDLISKIEKQFNIWYRQKRDKKEYILPKDNSVYELYYMNSMGRYKIGISIYYDPTEDDLVLSMDTPTIRREYGGGLTSPMEGKRYLVTRIGLNFGVIRESPSRGMKFYKLYKAPKSRTPIAIKETEDGIVIKKLGENDKVKIRRITGQGEEKYIIE